MNNEIVFMYSGQGSQYYHAASDLFVENQAFKKCMLQLDTMAQDYGIPSVVKELYNPQKKISDPFDKLQITHPAIFMLGYSMTQVLIEKGIEANYYLGSSLGEYIALVTSGRCSEDKMLHMLIETANLIEKEKLEGAMLAVLDKRSLFDEEPSIFEDCEFAAESFENHFVVSGDRKAILKLEKELQIRGKNFHRLPVNTAFHSSLIDRFEQSIKKLLNQIPLNNSNNVLVSCAHKTINPKVTVDYLWDIVRRPICFKKTVTMLEEIGSYTYIDLGASGTLSSFVSNCLSKQSLSKNYTTITHFGENQNKIDNLIHKLSHTKKQYTTNSIKSKTMKAFIFPGQGSQKVGMGKGLFEEFPDIMEKADEILGYSIKELCLVDPHGELVQTQNAQVALFVVNTMHYYKQLNKTQPPHFLAGHSLGEFNALLAAGAFDFNTGLKLVKKRGELMAKANGGGMAAVIGLNKEGVVKVLKDNDLLTLDVANYNTPSQIVISGPKADVLAAKPVFEKSGASLYIPLAVSGAFHSRYMKDSADEFGQFLNKFQFNDLSIPVISNVTARLYEADKIKESLERQMVSSVKWQESIQYLMGKGVEEFNQVDGGTVLMDMVKKIRVEAEVLLIEESRENSEQKEVPIVLPKSDIDFPEKLNPTAAGKTIIKAMELGSESYRKAYQVKYAYASGAMHHGISSPKMIVRMNKAGMMSYYATSGLSLKKIEEDILKIRQELQGSESFGVNIEYDLNKPDFEKECLSLLQAKKVKNIEIANYFQPTEAIVSFRAQGLKRDHSGKIVSENRIQVKVSRSEIAELFLSPASDQLIQCLLEANKITPLQAQLLQFVPVATDICVVSDGGGNSENAASIVLLPLMIRLKKRLAEKYHYQENIHLGAAGGIGTPEAAACSFFQGADFIVTGSINQCTVEAQIGDTVKDMIEKIGIHDMAYAPSTYLFELGSKVQVLKKGVFFPARANKLFELYKQCNSLDDLDIQLRKELENKYFKKSIEEVIYECERKCNSEELQKIADHPKFKMAMVFKWYLEQATQAALSDNVSNKINYQVYCGPSLGAFNEWVKGTELEKWNNRNVDNIGIRILEAAADFINKKYFG
ncbi:ACP S-malonyltransferase [Chryseobacterium sp. c4a]|uniref:ACP S-malonyltransferase n=1 Tax=Chryseobacterium sp. c4a TaxID=1573582 RepID=UPI00135A91C4|nr:ACP S-malonyltransferase [Chryseobacterium sp. c4a]